MYEWVGRLTGHLDRLPGIARWIRWVPRPVMLGICSLLGWLVWKKENHLRTKVLDNMGEVLTNRNQLQIGKECRRYFRNFFITVYEVLIDSFRLEQTKRWRFQVSGEANLQEALSAGKGVIVFTPHLGNFFYYYWYLSRRYPCLTVVTAGSPELRPLYLLFQQLGCRGLDYDATPPMQLIRTLRKHLRQNGVVFLLGDFWRPTFPQARLFDRITRSPAGTTALALEQQVPVVPFYGYRRRGFRHQLVFGPAIHLHQTYRPDQRTEATNHLNRFLEDAITTVPGQWLYWFNAEHRWEEVDTAARQAEG
ncbi:lipid A biosynthesis acyltransferase [Brevibacillus humidisoli]|uniref:lysophospholipid acyltransferase family protein n=1 Tax=Brevibacillus humidisoli TaxID=2895522 RepID=UPI001E5FB2CC|nr:lipid A biosynthesis acyltransferase [Brevibacillus humidisoli]UFJ41653.1 lipid A biosynthesis acyltransferase [Brevibacillus humidisoli]